MSSAVNTLIWLYFQQHHPNLATTFAKEGKFDINQYVELFGTKTIENVVIASDCRESCKRQREKDERIMQDNGVSKESISNITEEELQGNVSAVNSSINNIVNKNEVSKDNKKSYKKGKRDLCTTINREVVDAHNAQEKNHTLSESSIQHAKNVELGNHSEKTKQRDAESTSQSVSEHDDETKNAESHTERKSNKKLHNGKSNANVEAKHKNITSTSEEASNANNKLGVKQRFQRIDPTKVRFEAEELKHNQPHDTHLRVRQNQEMMQVKGKNFNKLKQKNKGKFYGAGVDLTVRSYQFPDSDEEEPSELTSVAFRRK